MLGFLRFFQSAFVPYVTAGFPTPDETVNILLAMEAGGAGKPRSHPVSDNRALIRPPPRHNRARHALHGPNRRWPSDSKSEYRRSYQSTTFIFEAKQMPIRHFLR